ncbi:hypothetical protein Tco_0419025, partial [Tanacetum coccineum]
HSTDPNQTPINDQPSTSSNTQKKLKPRRKQRKETKEHEYTSSSDPLSSGEDSFELNELMVFCVSLQEQLLDLQNAKAAQAKKIATLKKKVKKLERKRRSKPIDFKRFKKAGIVRRKKSSTVKDSLDDADLMFDTLVLEGDKVVAEHNKVVTEHGKEPEVVTTVSGPTTTADELTVAQTLIEIAKSKKVEAITTVATSVTTTVTSVTTAIVTRPPKKKGIVFHDLEEQVFISKLTFSLTKPTSKDKGKAIMIEPEKPLKKKDQIAADEELAKKVNDEMQAELEEEERIRNEKEEKATLVLIELWKDKQAMMEADRLLCKRLQVGEKEELTIEDKSKLFVELMNKRKKHLLN